MILPQPAGQSNTRVGLLRPQTSSHFSVIVTLGSSKKIRRSASGSRFRTSSMLPSFFFPSEKKIEFLAFVDCCTSYPMTSPCSKRRVRMMLWLLYFAGFEEDRAVNAPEPRDPDDSLTLGVIDDGRPFLSPLTSWSRSYIEYYLRLRSWQRRHSKYTATPRPRPNLYRHDDAEARTGNIRTLDVVSPSPESGLTRPIQSARLIGSSNLPVPVSCDLVRENFSTVPYHWQWSRRDETSGEPR